MPIAEFPAVISPESILRDGTGDFSARRATDGSHDGQIYQNANSNTAISAHHATGKTHTGQLPPNLSEQLTISPRHATRKSHTGRILPGPGTRPTTTRPPSDHTIAPRTDTTEFRRPLNAIGTPCDSKVARQTDTSRIQHQDGDICPPCAHAVAPRADGRLQATDRQPPASIRDPHDDNKERPASNNDGRPEPIIAPDAHSSRPLVGYRTRVSGIHPASSYLLFQSGLLKRLIEVGNQIIRILNAHGQAHQVRRNLKRRPGHRSVGHGRRQLNQGFHAAE